MNYEIPYMYNSSSGWTDGMNLKKDDFLEKKKIEYETNAPRSDRRFSEPAVISGIRTNRRTNDDGQSNQ